MNHKVAPFLLCAALVGVGCSKTESASVVYVTVTAPAGMRPVTQLRVNLAYAGRSDTELFPNTNSTTAISFVPAATFVLDLPHSSSGSIDVAVDALDSLGNPVAHGENTAPIVAGGRTNVTVALGAENDGDGGVLGSDASGIKGTGGNTGTGGIAGIGGTTSTGGTARTGTGGATGTGGNTNSRSDAGLSDAADAQPDAPIVGAGGSAGGITVIGGITSAGDLADAINEDVSVGQDTYVAPDVYVAPDTTVVQPDTGSASTVTFSTGRGQGAMTGYGWVTLGASDSITSPTCGLGNTAITSAAPCTGKTNWSSTTALCVTGAVPALPASPTQADYDNNLGIQVGINATEPVAAIAKSYTTIAVNVTGVPGSGLRIELHRSGDLVGTTYCALLVSSAPVLLTRFNTACWDNSGTAFTAADAAKIDKVGIQVSATTVAIPVTNLCLNGITFGS
jgi:hypothetical protein